MGDDAKKNVDRMTAAIRQLPREMAERLMERGADISEGMLAGYKLARKEEEK